MIFARWALTASALGVIGAFGASLLHRAVNPRVISVGRRAAVALLVACCLTLAAQLYEWFGVEGFTNPENVVTLISASAWGQHWTWMTAVAASAVFLMFLAGSQGTSWIFARAVAAIGVAAFVPLIGHAGSLGPLPQVWHRLHLFGAGIWLGSLIIAVVAGRKNVAELIATLRRFAPLALTGAALVGASGVLLAVEHLGRLSALWQTAYGRVLMAKVCCTFAVGTLGFLNWREPRIRAVVAELAVAFVMVLGFTAWLSQLATPCGH